MSVKEEDESTAKSFAAQNEKIITNLVPQIINKADLITLFTSIIVPMSDVLEKSEEAAKKARPPRTNQNPE